MVCDDLIQASLIRKIWEVVEQTQSVLLLQWTDQDMVSQLLCQIQHQCSLNGQEQQDVKKYLRDRITLIRDVAADRRGVVY